MNKELYALAVLNAFCLVVQLLPVISVPITSASSRFYLSQYQSYSFGVFGICDLQTSVCSHAKIGYPPVNSTFYELASEQVPDVGGIALPSNATYAISKLLVVHVIAFGFLALLLLVVLFLISLEYVDELDKSYFFKMVGKPNIKNEPVEEEFLPKDPTPKKKTRDITVYINVMLSFSLLSFICTLLGLLADILLFIPNLSYVGWLQLFPVTVLTLISAMLCFVKRTLYSRRYLELEHKYENDDMRLRKNILERRWSDDASDDGFYVYTNGFYSAHNGEGTVGPAGRANSLHSGWIHHTYRNESAEEISINSLRSEAIELEPLTREDGESPPRPAGGS
ncbi:pali-domain-containing protein [Suhomyces tanzawaensis NRRL Y-17324]|uniref:Pali-domain-containing protein n=1 Tax=Suhomyces tanzawaensis NRRL Y-17324 TaxID=984487 RepID=A0A1E4SQJ9_9ASCO|nr:pali-domain-containing protein [Suhomyces tanzawaensis NRRL Y-17324]ODV81786.1 pali-domain-containing protein [Suhomyces tanzawaensis NRRL Y-17324]